MGSFYRIALVSPLPIDGLKSAIDLTPGQLPALQSFNNYIGGLAAGTESALLIFNIGSTLASAKITVLGTITTGQSFSVGNIVLTAVVSGALVNQFVVAANTSIQAANIAKAISESPDLKGIVTATSIGPDVMIEAGIVGSIGDGLQFSKGTLANVTIVPFADGKDGETQVLNFI